MSQEEQQQEEMLYKNKSGDVLSYFYTYSYLVIYAYSFEIN